MVVAEDKATFQARKPCVAESEGDAIGERQQAY